MITDMKIGLIDVDGYPKSNFILIRIYGNK